MTTKATPPVLSLQSKRSLTKLFDELLAAVEVLIGACRKTNWSEVDDSATNVKSYVRSIKDEIPDGLGKSQVSKLDSHAQFVEVYARKRDRKFVLSNAQSIRPKSSGWRLRLASAVQGLSDPERLLLDQCRGFRNFAAHPSEYN